MHYQLTTTFMVSLLIWRKVSCSAGEYTTSVIEKTNSTPLLQNDLMVNITARNEISFNASTVATENGNARQKNHSLNAHDTYSIFVTDQTPTATHSATKYDVTEYSSKEKKPAELQAVDGLLHDSSLIENHSLLSATIGENGTTATPVVKKVTMDELNLSAKTIIFSNSENQSINNIEQHTTALYSAASSDTDNINFTQVTTITNIEIRKENGRTTDRKSVSEVLLPINSTTVTTAGPSDAQLQNPRTLESNRVSNSDNNVRADISGFQSVNSSELLDRAINRQFCQLPLPSRQERPRCSWKTKISHQMNFWPSHIEVSICVAFVERLEQCQVLCENVRECQSLDFCLQCIEYNCRLFNETSNGPTNLRLTDALSFVDFHEKLTCNNGDNSRLLSPRVSGI